jgi:pyridoxal phosphate-dependent aminotransferase EpsN
LPYYEHHEIGYNYRMSPINAAVGLSEWSDIEIKLKERKIVFEGYQDALQSIPGFQFPEQSTEVVTNHWFSTVLIDRNRTVNHSGSREVMQKLALHGVEARLMWNPMHRQPVFQQYKSILNGVADQLFEWGLCLPSDHSALQHQPEIINVITEI